MARPHAYLWTSIALNTHVRIEARAHLLIIYLVSQGFTNDGDDIQEMMSDSFRWTNLCNDLAVDSTFGSNFAMSSTVEPLRVYEPQTTFSD